MDSGCVAIAYETVQLDSGELPLLTPMSEVAGPMALPEGAKSLQPPPATSPESEIAQTFPRQALHAWRLTLRHPASGKELSIEAPLPADMRELIKALKL